MLAPTLRTPFSPVQCPVRHCPAVCILDGLPWRPLPLKSEPRGTGIKVFERQTLKQLRESLVGSLGTAPPKARKASAVQEAAPPALICQEISLRMGPNNVPTKMKIPSEGCPKGHLPHVTLRSNILLEAKICSTLRMAHPVQDHKSSVLLRV